MLGEIPEVIFIIIALFGASFLSYKYFDKYVEPPKTIIFQQDTSETSSVLPSVSLGKVPQGPENITSSEVIKDIPVVTEVPVSKQVVAPGPLLAPTSLNQDNPSSDDLSVSGVIKYTNEARLQNGNLLVLTENKKLDHDAQIKISDMFSKQYFEHVSPSGVGPSELAKAVGYEYILVGENLALGNFQGDAKLLDAWMNSPGHRANILNGRYREIGAAVGRGMYHGDEVWLAVQSFGLPLSACPVIDAHLKAVIESNNIQLVDLRAKLDAKKIEIQGTSTDDSNYNIYAEEYNAIIKPYNDLVEKNRALITDFNAQTHAFNDCAQVK
jgi:uncharacterized protein YkwD